MPGKTTLCRRDKFAEPGLMVIMRALRYELPDLSDEHVNYLAFAAMDALIARFHGHQIYIPIAAYDQRRYRDKAIAASYDGTRLSIKRLAKRYRITEIHVYRILAKELGPRRQAKGTTEGTEGQGTTGHDPSDTAAPTP
mgnify:CR=1 FL=1